MATATYIDGQFEPTPQELSLIDSVGTSPCVFKLGDSFYDYTPIKLAYPAPYAPYFDGNPVPLTTTPKYEFVFGWCQHLSDIADQPLCKEDVFAGRVDYPDPTPSSECMQYSGSSSSSDISTKEISGVPLTVKRMRALKTQKLDGVQLSYTNG